MSPLSRSFALLPLLWPLLLATDFHSTDSEPGTSCSQNQVKDETYLLQVKQDVVARDKRAEKAPEKMASPASLAATGASTKQYPGMPLPEGTEYLPIPGYADFPGIIGGYGALPAGLGGYGGGVAEVMSPGLAALPEVVMPELDTSWSGTMTGDIKQIITIPKGSTRREAMSIIHKFATSQIKFIYLESLHDQLRRVAAPVAYPYQGLAEWEAVIDASVGSVPGIDGLYSKSANADVKLFQHLLSGTKRRQAIQQFQEFAVSQIKSIWTESLLGQMLDTGYPMPSVGTSMPSGVPPRNVPVHKGMPLPRSPGRLHVPK